MRKKVSKVAIEEVLATEHGKEVAKVIIDACDEMGRLGAQIRGLPHKLAARATYLFFWFLLYGLPVENQIKFLEACVEEIKKKGKEWGDLAQGEEGGEGREKSGNC